MSFRKKDSRVESGVRGKRTPLLGVSVQNAIHVALSTEHRDNHKWSFFISVRRRT